MPKTLLQRVDEEVPIPDGWWRESCQETFHRLAKSLIEHGYSEDEAIELLCDAYIAVSGEYGN